MNILEEIKSTEQRAAEIRRDAQMKAREIQRDGEIAAAASVSKIVEAAEREAAKRLEAAREAAEKKAEEFLAKSSQNDDAVIGAAESKLQAATGYIVKSAGDIQ